MKRDIIVATCLLIVVLFVGISVKTINNNSYAVNFENEEIELIDHIHKLDEYINEVEEETMLETTYTLDEVYQSIYALKEDGVNTITSDMNNIYVNFYRYFDKENNFYNMYGESYDYDEYKFLKKHHLMKDNDEMFGLYLTTYSKCEVFGLVDSDERNDNLEVYCSER